MAITICLLVISAVVFLMCELGKTKDRSKLLDIPTVSYSRFLPNFLNRLVFFITGPSLIHYGYNKVSSISMRVNYTDQA